MKYLIIYGLISCIFYYIIFPIMSRYEVFFMANLMHKDLKNCDCKQRLEESREKCVYHDLSILRKLIAALWFLFVPINIIGAIYLLLNSLMKNFWKKFPNINKLNIFWHLTQMQEKLILRLPFLFLERKGIKILPEIDQAKSSYRHIQYK